MLAKQTQEKIIEKKGRRQSGSLFYACFLKVIAQQTQNKLMLRVGMISAPCFLLLVTFL